MVDWTKPIRIRGRRREMYNARFLGEINSMYPMTVACSLDPLDTHLNPNVEVIRSFTTNGTNIKTGLVVENTPEKRKIEVWVNVYDDRTFIHYSKEEAERKSTGTMGFITCVHLEKEIEI